MPRKGAWPKGRWLRSARERSPAERAARPGDRAAAANGAAGKAAAARERSAWGQIWAPSHLHLPEERLREGDREAARPPKSPPKLPRVQPTPQPQALLPATGLDAQPKQNTPTPAPGEPAEGCGISARLMTANEGRCPKLQVVVHCRGDPRCPSPATRGGGERSKK